MQEPATDDADYEEEWQTSSTDGNEMTKSGTTPVPVPEIVHPLPLANAIQEKFDSSSAESLSSGATGPQKIVNLGLKAGLTAHPALSQSLSQHRIAFPPEIVHRHAQARTLLQPSVHGTLEVTSALVASRRVKAYRVAEQLRIENQLKLEKAPRERRKEAWNQSRQFHEQLGVANLSCEQQLEIHNKKMRQQANEHKKAEATERQNRWYHRRQQSRKFCYNAQDQAQLFLRNEATTRARENKKIQQLKQRIAQRQERLEQSARQIIERTGGSYVKGSYILKRDNNSA